jgi:tetratricopeptide (TPR) repeat protein
MVSMSPFEKGNELYDLGKFEEAIECFDQAKDKNICDIFEKKCHSLNYIGRYREAKNCADEAISNKCIKKALALAIKAEALSYLGNYKDAKVNADDAINLAKNEDKGASSCYALFVKGHVLDYSGKHCEAIKHFEEVIGKKGCLEEQVEALTGKGITLNYLGMTNKGKDKTHYEKAKECFDSAIEKCGKNNSARYQDIAYAYINKSTSLYNLERNKEEELDCCLTDALSYSNKSISMNPHDAHAWMIKGVYYLKLDFYEMAIECFDKIIMDNSEFDFAWCLKGYALNYLERYKEALKCFDEAIKISSEEINSQDPDYYMGKGISLYNLEKYDDAIKCFDQVIALEEAYSDIVLFLKAASNYGNHRYVEALQDFKKVSLDTNLEGQNLTESDLDFIAAVHNSVGACYYRLDLVEEARNEYDSAIKSNPKLAEAYYNLGILDYDDGKINRARNLFKKCLEVESSFTKAREALERIDTPLPASDWFKYWFSNEKAKKAFGVALILSIFALISVIAATSTSILYHNQNIALNSLDNPSLVSEAFNINQSILSSAITGITIMIGLLIVVLLLPSIRRIKVADVELEPVPIDTKVPQRMDVLISKMRKVGMQSF